MHDNQKNLRRATQRISAQLQRLRSAPVLVELPAAHWTECQSLVHRIHLSRSRSWKHAAALLEDRLERALSRCSERLQEISRHISSSGRVSPPQTAREIFRDLVALSDEFEAVTIDVPNQTLSVTTEPIVLEEIGLGPFEIRLHWDRIGERRPYEVVALEPNPARESGDTTHPHVRGEQLCEGDGQMSIERALQAGRLLDFFQVVSRILDTYNSSSAYVSLSGWDGSPCADCGDLLGEDDEYACDHCGDMLCRECLTACERCDAICCHTCTNYCRGCEAQICSRCQQDCSGCQRLLCSQCLSETGLCQECQEKRDAESINEDDTPPVEAEAPVAPTARDADPEQAAASASV
jgi:hypothetical protein